MSMGIWIAIGVGLGVAIGAASQGRSGDAG
jgi:hypothetical protein